jgi:hypothetical protein
MAGTSNTDSTIVSAGDGRHNRGRLAQQSMLPALILVTLGALFLLRNLGILPAWGNWWALFILIPAAAAAGTAWSLYRSAGDRLSPAARRAAMGAVTLTFVAAIFLFDLSWGLLWPVFLILAGIEALVSRGNGVQDHE